MKEIRIEFNVGPLEGNEELIGSYHFKCENPNKSFIINALKKSIARLKITNEIMIVGLFDVFIDNEHQYEVGILGIQSLLYTEIKKL
jgi:hypothetical protein